MKRKSGHPTRSLASLPPGLGIALVLLVAALAFLLPQGIGKAEAYSVTNDGRIMVNASQVHVSMIWYEAEFNNVFGMDSPVSQDLFGCRTQPAGVPIDLGVFNAGELVFRLRTPDGNTWLTGPASRNADNFQHAQLEVMSDTVVRIHWEDQYGGGDQDFNDCNVEVTIEDLPTPTSTNTATPTATSTAAPTATSTSTVVPTATVTDTPTAVSTGTHTPPPTDTPTATATEAERSHERRHTATPVAVPTTSVGNSPAPTFAPVSQVSPAVTTRQSPSPAQSLPSSGTGGEHEPIWATTAGVLSSLLGAVFVLAAGGWWYVRRRNRAT